MCCLLKCNVYGNAIEYCKHLFVHCITLYLLFFKEKSNTEQDYMKTVEIHIKKKKPRTYYTVSENLKYILQKDWFHFQGENQLTVL